MSGSLLEDKENVAISHEFAKEDPAHITSSILKPSQKQNVGQLTPKKPPKVTFKNTPLRHHPIRYKVEQPGQLLDTWEEIRYLDEEENWTERTQVVTKEDHQLHLVAAKEILDYIIDTLPCFNSPKKEVKETTESCEQKDTESAVPIEIKAMDESLDLAGPLDPAIASLNSLLKAGEDEERAFSPIGSGKVSPDCDNMVTSDDIEKLLSPHVMPEEMDIPSLELFSSNRIDAFMDSTFSGKHLDEVAAKLNKLKLSSTTINGGEDDFDLPIKPRGVKTSPPKEEPQKVNDDDFDNLPIKPRAPKTSLPKDEPQKENDDDFNNLPIKPRAPKTSLPQDEPQEKNDDDFDNLPIKPRAPKTSPPTVEEENKDDEDIDLPIKPRGAKIPAAKVEEEKKDNEEMKENGNEEENLPVKRRQPKAVAPKKDVQPGNDEDETFKKPMPPKPWKTKKKKAPQNEDPFAIMFAEPAKGISSNEKSAEDKPHSEQKPVNGEGWEGMSAKQKVNNENHDNTTSGVDGVVFSEQQDDFGFTNDDFQTGNDFSLELDYLEKFGNSNNLDRLSALARQSLYVKFDPLCKGRSPDQQALQRMTADANALKQSAGNVDDLLLSTPPSRRAQTKLTSIKESDGRPKTTSDLSAVDKLLTFSPVAKDAQPSKPVETKRQETTSTQEDDGALVQPLLYSKSDIEVAVKKEREALLKQTHEESQFREMEIQDILSKLQTEVEKNSKLKRENDELKTVMKEYEKTMAEMIESTKKDKNSAEGTKNEIVKERDQLQADLNSVEAAFSDLHRRYEKMKGALENFKKNEEILKKAAQDYQEKLRKSSEKYQMLKKHAEEKIETANIEINRVRRSNDSEMAVMRAALKKEQNKCASLEQAIQQKINENKELTAICDELIQRASSK